MSGFVDRIRLRLIPALLTAVGVGLLALGILSYSNPVDAVPTAGASPSPSPPPRAGRPPPRPPPRVPAPPAPDPPPPPPAPRMGPAPVIERADRRRAQPGRIDPAR